MPKRMRRNDQDFLRFQPYRAIVAPPLNQKSTHRKRMVAAVGVLVVLALLAAVAIYALQRYLTGL